MSAEIATINGVTDALEAYWRTLGLPGELREYLDAVQSAGAISGTNAAGLRIVFSADLALQSAIYSFRHGSVREAWQDLGYAMYCVGRIHGADADEATTRGIETLREKRPVQRLRTVMSEWIVRVAKELETKNGSIPSCPLLLSRLKAGHQARELESRYDKKEKQIIIEGERFTPKQFREAYRYRYPQKKAK